MAVHVLALKSGVTTAQLHRLGLGALWPQAGSRFQRRSGLLPGDGAVADLAGTAGTMDAAVKPFTAWISGTGVQGGYSFVNGSDAPITFPDGEPAVARIDRVIARVYDHPYDASGVQEGAVEVLKGQPNGAATTLPPTSLLLWEVTVPAGASTGGTPINWATARADRRRYTATAGGTIPVVDTADRDSLTPYEGLRVWRRDVRAPQVYTAGEWRWPTTIVVANAADRDAKIPHKIAGQQVWRADLRITEIWDGTRWYEQDPITIVRGGDLTVPNTNWLDDPQLGITVPAGGGYELSGMLIYSAHQDADLRVGWTGPANAWMDWTCRAPALGSTGTTGAQFVDRQFLSSAPAMGGGDTSNGLHLTATLHGMFWSGDGGTLRLRCAQRANHGTPSLLRGPSFVSLRRAW
ncbi:hypothetical protein SMC26_40275 [Actinomadura fulvescens]|uniref:Minor tail protein n=1 Tax=Actinomadura fulvescens TaxID=46160 RepID=A0ABP6CIY9_9ACTN